MKFLQFIFRVALGVTIGLVLSLSSARFFDTDGYTQTDNIFLVAVPALAIAYLFLEVFPLMQKWAENTTPAARILHLGISFIAAGLIARADMLITLALTVIFSALTFPAVPVIERRKHAVKYYLPVFLLSLAFCYAAIGFFDEALNPFYVFLFAGILIPLSSISGYYLIRRAARSLQGGFLSAPLNLIITLILPLLAASVLWVSAQFPEMFVWEYITIPKDLSNLYFAGAFISGAWGLAALNRFEESGYDRKWGKARLFSFIKENLPGVYTGGIFFLINLIIARALNHPAFSYNSVVFETDAGPWMSILASPQSDAVNRAVHPLVLIISRPLIRSLGVFMGEHWNLAAIFIVALLSGLCVLMGYLFVKRAVQAETYSVLFAIFLGVTSAHLLFGSLTENYVFGMTSLIFFFLLIQSGENRFSRLVPTGVIVFGITVTNITQTAIALFFNKFGFWKVIRYSLFVVTLGVALTMFVDALYPKAQTFFFVPADLAFEGNFVKPASTSPLANAKEKLQVAARSMFLYEIVAPEPLIVISQKKNDPFPTIDLKTFDWREHKLASYKGVRNIPLTAWLFFLAGAVILFAKNARTSRHLPLALGLLGILAFNFVMHNFYGTELFLYTPYWAYALVFFTALAYAEFAHNRWFETFFALFVLMTAANNLWFIFVILRALAPFFAG